MISQSLHFINTLAKRDGTGLWMCLICLVLIGGRDYRLGYVSR